jgi:hypothetical protein
MWWWIVSFGYSYHNNLLQYCLTTVILAAAAKTISQQRMQAAHGVATVQSRASKLPVWYFIIILLPYCITLIRL